jgi:hypothetical protein
MKQLQDMRITPSLPTWQPQPPASCGPASRGRVEASPVGRGVVGASLDEQPSPATSNDDHNQAKLSLNMRQS